MPETSGPLRTTWLYGSEYCTFLLYNIFIWISCIGSEVLIVMVMKYFPEDRKLDITCLYIT
jgi:hypothetical protein